ncbi:MAG: amidohydrolase family protein [Anaerolineae bacterium]|nr:amidohydrolase family protein [Anaerolineae bacterium]
MSDQEYSLRGVTLVTPTKVHPNSTLTISGKHIAALDTLAAARYGLDMQDCLLFPGLINAHDHLNGTWWPRVAPNRPYINVYEWLADFNPSPIVAERKQNSVEDVYELGMYRNLISGVTTVADHFWRINGPEFYTRYPIHVLYEYGRTWTPRELTNWGDDVPTEYGNAVRDGQPYIIHLAEGVDSETATEMDVLLEYDALGRNTMAIHGIALRPHDMELIARAGASVCLCPRSNLYLYDQTANVSALLAAGVHLTIGTDSVMTGGLNLLDEARGGRQSFGAKLGEEPSAKWLVELMTTHAAYSLMLQDRRGRIAVGYEADLLALHDNHEDPYKSIVEAHVDDIALVICAGVPVYGDAEYHDLFEQFSPGFTPVSVAGKAKLLAGDVLSLLERVAATIGHTPELPFLPCTAQI